MAVAVALAVAVRGGGAVAVAVAGLTKRFFNHIQKDFLINVWGYERNDDDDDNDGDDDDDDMEPYKITCRKTQVQLAAGTVSVRGECVKYKLKHADRKQTRRQARKRLS